MKRQWYAWLCQPGIGRRIALAMILSLVAVQAQAFLQLWLLVRPEIRVVGTRWLATVAYDAARETFAAPPEQREAILREKQRIMPVRFHWGPSSPQDTDGASDGPGAARLAATLRDLLGSDDLSFHITSAPLGGLFPVSWVRVVVSPPEVADLLGDSPVRAGEPEVLIPASFRIAIQGQDGSWVSIEPIGFQDTGPLSGLPITPLLAGGLIIIIVSIFTARHIVAPLDRLVVAADRIGAAREFVSVAATGLGEFAAVARAFEDMQRRLLRFVEDRTQMLAAISHDLRSSLTRLRLEAEERSGDAGGNAFLEEIDEMEAMVESTLAFAGGEAQMAPRQPIDIAALLISLADNAADLGRPCEYRGPDHAEAIGHPLSLKRAFGNLINNAVTYGSVARISLEVAAYRVHIAIDDDGPGIPLERREEAFAPFRRLERSRSGKLPGAGLGLTIARDVILSHGGTIELGIAPGGGLSVSIELSRR